jgi:RHS repeat-associated protein
MDSLRITYGPEHTRKISILWNGIVPVKKKTFAGNFYELEEDAAGNKRHLWYIPGPDGEVAIFVKQNSGAITPYYIHKDYQGSYQTITDGSGNIATFNSVQQVYSFDPWGRRRNAVNWSYTGVPTSFLFDRGYTGHEHLDKFGLINMNGRVFDPALAHFLSPDNFVQAPGNTQSFNRYGYCLNNPLLYTDPTGNTWWSHLTGWSDEHNIGETILGFTTPNAGFSLISSAFKGNWDITMNGSAFNNSSRIFGGLFQADQTQAGWGWQIVSRFTWESPQTALGYSFANLANNFGNVDAVDYYAGATVLRHQNSIGGAFTLGSYIQGGPDIRADPSERYFQHEYGHVLQSRKFGLAYISSCAIPSLVSAMMDDGTSTSKWNHNYSSIEQDANKRALDYWRKRDPDYNDWKFYDNPILKNKSSINISWMDYILPPAAAYFTSYAQWFENAISNGNRDYINEYGLIYSNSDYDNYFK